uniref:Cadherin domain-containing protein n=1 Tax=Crocodylus porosus TaxID=8502 RepID=A0A7M4FMA9_CROPO
VLRALCTLDYEVLQVLELEVEACDAGTPPQCSQSHVHVHVLDGNDHAPSIVTPPLVNSSAELPLPCHAPPGFLLAHIAAQDADEGPNAELSYSIVAGAHDLFALHEHTGVLWLRRRLWGGEVQAALPLVIMVQDGGWPTLSCTATLQLVPTDVLPSRVEIVVPQLLAEEQSLQPGLDPSMVFIVVLAGGCCLLLAAIIGVVSTCGKGVSGCKGRPRDKSSVIWHPPGMGDADSSNVY